MELDPGGFKEEAVPLIMGKELSGGESRSKTENMDPLTQMSSEQKTNEKLMMIIDDQARQIRELMQTIKDQTAKIDSLAAQMKLLVVLDIAIVHEKWLTLRKKRVWWPPPTI
ncbi:unnamed protein product [Acanthoscelides obtectus]|uniref:Uncharacterized protein n=1 Tax=Acanthoscelides obtectus TaxID=200917 RepID=A0A9P0KNV5_ACAOB|nr:unnamed protein product [Acanthoscelides obtectus]CAK1667614.1 hypothetical protein AOBTE_LOCUS25947 [Acanthoscelides obtectus]